VRTISHLHQRHKVGRIDVDKLQTASIIRQKGFEGFEVVALDEKVVLGALGITERASFVSLMGLEKTEGNEGCSAEGVFLTGPG